MYGKTTNTKARAYALRATLTAAAAVAVLAFQTAPSSAREHHRHHRHDWHNAQASAEAGTAQASNGRSFTGMASYYGNESGSRTASGQRMNPSAMTAAHRTLPFGTKLRVTHGGRSVVVTI